MAPLPVIANVFRCAFNHFGPGASTVNILHVRKASATASDVASDLQTAASAGNIFDEMISGFTTPSVTITPLDGTTAATDHPITGLDGTGGGDELPAYAMVVSLKTAQRGSRGRGRIYVGPLGETLSHGGKMLTADAAAVATIYGNFIAALVGAGSQLVVASYKHADAHDVVSHRVDIPFGVQRRRQDRLVR